VDEEVLEKLAQDHPICAALLEHRGVAKLKSTYTDKLPRMVHREDRDACTRTTRRRWR
jgi:DNA polymerase-1